MKEVIVSIVAIGAIVGVVFFMDSGKEIESLRNMQESLKTETATKLDDISSAVNKKLTVVDTSLTAQEKRTAALADQVAQLTQAMAKTTETLNEKMATADEQLALLDKRLSTPVNVDEKSAESCAIKISVLSDPDIREAACELMGLLGGTEVEKRLANLAINDKQDDVRQKALQALIKLKSSELAQVVPTVLRSNNSRNRRMIASYLKENPKPQWKDLMFTTLEKHVASDSYDDVQTRESLYSGLKSLVTSKDVARIKTLHGKDAKAKSHAFDLLLSVSASDYEEILELLEGNTSPEALSQDLLKSLAKDADQRLTPILAQSISAKDWHVRQEAIRLLALLKDPLAAKSLFIRQNAEQDSDCRRELGKLFAAGYPGIQYDENTKKASLIPTAELDKLIVARNAKVAERTKKTPPAKPAPKTPATAEKAAEAPNSKPTP